VHTVADRGVTKFCLGKGENSKCCLTSGCTRRRSGAAANPLGGTNLAFLIHPSAWNMNSRKSA
jgi:hypothetical protein